MANPLRVQDLNIVGYANVLPQTMLPSIVPPIFCLRSKPDRFFVPPYSFNNGHLYDAGEISNFELTALADDREVTIFPEGFSAKVGYELYVDEEFQHHYQTREKVNASLDEIADRSIAEAKIALIQRDFKKADRLAGVAISANDRKFESLVIKAAVDRALGDSAGERLMASIAQRLVSITYFNQMVDDYYKTTVASTKKPPSSQSSMHSKQSAMHEMACSR